MISVLAFVFILGIMIFLHELGHFLAARSFGIRVETFSLGFGRRLCGFRRNGTDYRVSMIPLGGFVKMAGEHFSEDATGDPGEFLSKPRWQRAVVTAAGPLMNLLFAVFLLWVNYMVGVEVPGFYQAQPRVGLVGSNSPAAGKGLETGDFLVAVNGSDLASWSDFVMASVSFSNQSVPVTFSRGGVSFQRQLQFRETETDPSEITGIYPFIPIYVEGVAKNSPAERAGLRAGDEILSVTDGQSVQRGFLAVFRLIRDNAGSVDYGLVADGLFRLCSPASPGFSATDPGWGRERNPFSGIAEGRRLQAEVRRDDRTMAVSFSPDAVNRNDGRGLAGFQLDFRLVTERYGPWLALNRSLKDNLRFVAMTYRVLAKVIGGTLSIRQFSGPIGIARASGDAVKTGNLVVVFNFMALISMNLAVLNLLPIPVLDGGMLFFLLLEMVFRRDIPLRFKERAVTAGMLLLLTFMAVVVFFDVYKMFR